MPEELKEGTPLTDALIADVRTYLRSNTSHGAYAAQMDAIADHARRIESALTASRQQVEQLTRERNEARQETQSSRRELQQKGQAISDALGRHRGTEDLISAAQRVAKELDAAESLSASLQEQIEKARQAAEDGDTYAMITECLQNDGDLRGVAADIDGQLQWVNDRYTSLQERVRELEKDAERYRAELRIIANARRFDIEYFDNDTSFADWAQSRARFAIDAARQPTEER